MKTYCALCGGEGHSASACPWAHPHVSMRYLVMYSVGGKPHVKVIEAESPKDAQYKSMHLGAVTLFEESPMPESAEL